MKTTIIKTAVLLIIGTTVAFFSCRKEETNQPQNPGNEFNISSKNNRLVFKSIEDYEHVVNSPSTELQTKFIGSVNSLANFTSLEEKIASSAKERTGTDLSGLIKDNYFKSILNEDLAVQIGEYIFKINPSTEKVYALPTANENQYGDLVAENHSNSNIIVFSTDDDVLELIKSNSIRKDNVALREGSPQTNGLFCKETGAGSDSRLTDDVVYTSNLGVNKRFKGTVEYNKYGLYFRMYATANNYYGSTNDLTNDPVGIYLESVYYHVRCDNTVGPYSTYSASGGGGSHWYSSYQGSKALNKYLIRARFTVEGHETQSIEIRRNY